jgi:Ca2+-transporting ATPase
MNDSLGSPPLFLTAAPGGNSPARVSLVHSGVPGRIRVRVVGLYRSEVLKNALESLACQPWCVSIRVNVLTGTAVVHFTRGEPAARVLEVLENRVSAHEYPPISIARPEPARAAARPALPTLDIGLMWRWLGRIPPFWRRKIPEAAEPDVVAETPRRAWHADTEALALEALETGRDGLSPEAAASRLALHGRNVLSEQKPRSALSMLLGQVLNPPVALLGLSAGVSIATGGVADALVILGVVAINAAIGYATEAQAERIIGSLGTLTPSRARVIRGGRRVDIPLEEVVPGDVLVLEPGGYVPADGRLFASNRLTVDESALTGESLPAGKHHTFVGTADTPLADRRNMVHRGTVVTGGSGLAVAVATGRQTEIGLIQSLVGAVKTPETPLQRQLDRMGTQLAILSGAVCAGVFGLGLARGYPPLDMLKSSISLAVAAVPEGLPAVATTTLALGIREMQRRHVLVRQLPAVEGLGSIQTLCLDKTGTLTENRMRAVGVELTDCSITLADGGFRANHEPLAPLEREDLARLLEVVALCSEVKLTENRGEWHLDGSPTESALIEIALAAGIKINALHDRYPLVKTLHRAEDQPYMVTVHQSGEDTYRIAVKGSPAEVLALCSHRLNGGAPVELDEASRDAILARNERMAGQALRVLGVAHGHSIETATAALTQNLIWLGLVGMEDTIRPGMDALMARFHAAGIDTVMITGDQSTTAFSVGQRLGLNGTRPLEIIDSTHLDRLDPEVLAGIVTDTTVFARVSPAHKLRIVQALQASGRVVAMTGDGINDGPALKAADVGVALGNRGTEVARSVADVVLEDDNLHTMIAAVEQGRTIYANIRKSLGFLLSSNLSEIEIMLIGTAIGTGEVLNPIQLLWINLLTDILPGLALALEPPEQDVLRQAPRDPSEPIIRRGDAARLVRESLALTGGALGVYGYSLARHGAGPQAGGNTFMAITLAQLLHSISCRSEWTSVLDFRDRPPNRFLDHALLGSALLQVAAAFFPPLRSLLRLPPMGPVDWLAIVGGATLPFLVNEGIKRIRSQPARREGTP